MQCIEIELSRKNLEKDEVTHNLELAYKQIHRHSQQLEEEQQKIEMLNIQISSLQESLHREKQTQLETAKKLKETKDELTNISKIHEELLNENTDLKRKQEIAENMTDSVTKDAIMKLGMIILSSQKSYSLTPEQRYLLNQAFGENCSKIIDSYEKKIQELGEKNKELRENFSNFANLADFWLAEFLGLCTWIDAQETLLNDGEYDQCLENFEEKKLELSEKRKEAEQTYKNPQIALSISARLSIKEREDSMHSFTRPLFGSSASGEEYEKLQKKYKVQKKEIEELTTKLHDAYLDVSQMKEHLNDLTNHNSSLKKKTPKVEIIRFLQCQASLVEDLLVEQTIEE